MHLPTKQRSKNTEAKMCLQRTLMQSEDHASDHMSVLPVNNYDSFLTR